MERHVALEPVNRKALAERSLRDLYHVLFRHMRKIGLFFVAVLLAVMLGTFLVSEIYQSEAKLLVRVGRESVTLDPLRRPGRSSALVNRGKTK